MKYHIDNGKPGVGEMGKILSEEEEFTNFVESELYEFRSGQVILYCEWKCTVEW